MTIEAVQAAQSTCRVYVWCAAHIPMHLGVERVVEASYGPETHRIHAGLEAEPGGGPLLRIQGAGDAPMQLAQARELIEHLTELVAIGEASQAVTSCRP